MNWNFHNRLFALSSVHMQRFSLKFETQLFLRSWREELLRSNNPARKCSDPWNSGDFMEAVFLAGIFRLFPVSFGQILALSSGKRSEFSRKICNILAWNTASISVDFRSIPAGNDVCFWSFQPVPTDSGRRNDRPGYDFLMENIVKSTVSWQGTVARQTPFRLFTNH